MKEIAAGLAALGRGNDSVLIHMSPREVGGLQALAKAAGGSLTTNPHTGLPEAGFLQDILPTVAAIGLTMMGVPAWGVGLGTGLTSKATGKSTQDSLMSGLLAGGGAGLFGPGAAGGENMGVLPQMGSAANATPEAFAAAQSNLGPAAESMSRQAVSATIPGQSYMDNLGAGLKSAANDPMQFVKDNKYGVGALGIGALGAMGGMDQPGLQNIAPEQRGVNARLSGPVRRPYDETAPGGYYFTDRGTIQGNYAEGGIAALGGGDTYAAGGRLLEGPGDGVSDDIPAVIQGEKPQRAALADGEFVVPARIVSELGNGSTKAGAKRLYAMMERVQKARGKTVGKNKVAVDSKAIKHLPA